MLKGWGHQNRKWHYWAMLGINDSENYSNFGPVCGSKGVHARPEYLVEEVPEATAFDSCRDCVHIHAGCNGNAPPLKEGWTYLPQSRVRHYFLDDGRFDNPSLCGRHRLTFYTSLEENHDGDDNCALCKRMFNLRQKQQEVKT